MRVGKGCERCRDRHVRCVIPDGASSCTPCSRLGRICHLDPRFKFKTVRHVYQKSSGTSARFDLKWDTDQVWMEISRPVTFVLEASGHWQADETHQLSHAPLTRSPLHQESSPESYRDFIAGVSNDDRPPVPLISNVHQPQPQHQPLRELVAKNSLLPGVDEPATLSLREASLMRCFIQRIAPWADICDPQAHFATDVPRRALQVPMVLKAVMALTARHDAILTNESDWEASSFHGQCLELLIPVLDRPEQTYDDNLLVTVVILRIYEELENNTDQQFHLLGSNRLINLMSQSASSGGLAEAVSWQFLRQAIYASIVQYQPWQLDLRNYERSSMFQRHDDAAFANMAIFHCAHILQICRHVPQEPVDKHARREIADALEKWHHSKPATWQPLRYEAPDVAAHRPFPEIWMMSAPAVVGMQYYHATCIFLTFSDPCLRPKSDYEMARSRRLAEKTIASHISIVIGLSQSNESVHNAYFMACHLLHRFGYCLRHPVEQQGSLQFLAQVEGVLGWRTSWMRRELQQQWAELGEVNTPDI